MDERPRRWNDREDVPSPPSRRNKTKYLRQEEGRRVTRQHKEQPYSKRDCSILAGWGQESECTSDLLVCDENAHVISDRSLPAGWIASCGQFLRELGAYFFGQKLHSS